MSMNNLSKSLHPALAVALDIIAAIWPVSFCYLTSTEIEWIKTFGICCPAVSQDILCEHFTYVLVDIHIFSSDLKEIQQR